MNTNASTAATVLIGIVGYSLFRIYKGHRYRKQQGEFSNSMNDYFENMDEEEIAIQNHSCRQMQEIEKKLERSEKRLELIRKAFPDYGDVKDALNSTDEEIDALELE